KAVPRSDQTGAKDWSRPYAVARCRRPRWREIGEAAVPTVRKGGTRTFRRTRCQSAAVSFDYIVGAGADGVRELGEETWCTQEGCARPPRPGQVALEGDSLAFNLRLGRPRCRRLRRGNRDAREGCTDVLE